MGFSVHPWRLSQSGRLSLPLKLGDQLLAEGRQVVGLAAGHQHVGAGGADLYLFVHP